MLERYLVAPIKELIHGKPIDYDFNISKTDLPLYFETAGLYSKKDLGVKIIGKGGDSYETIEFGTVTLHQDFVRLRLTTFEKRGKTEVKRDFFKEVTAMREKIKNGSWKISIDTQLKVRDAFNSPQEGIVI